MQLKGLSFLINQSTQSFLRFPTTILSAIVSVVLSIYLVEYENTIVNKFPYINALLTSSIGIPLFFCATILSDILSFSKRINLGLQALVLLFLIGIYFTFPQINSTHNINLPYIRYGIYNLLSHLCISFIPYLFNKNLNGFWNYNKLLFIRFLTSNLYAGFIYIGIVLAILAINELFEIRIHSKLYFDWFVFCAFLFNTWFFVAGIPKKFEDLNNQYSYPKGLKIFAQYILLSLLVIYLIIIYSYASKILIDWNWPKGLVSYLILIVAVLGVFTFLLLYPYSKTTENIWIKNATKGYYIILIPLIALLFIALTFRINDYGITLKRYVLIVLGIWLLIVAIYTIFNKDNIKFIPISLAVLIFLTSFGPWGMFTFSERNQINRLQHILNQAKILDQNNKVINPPIIRLDTLGNVLGNIILQNQNKLNDSLLNEVKSILEYLDEYHGFEGIQGWYHQDINQLISQIEPNRYYNKEVELYMNGLGLEYKYYVITNKNYSYSIDEKNKSFIEVKNYDYVTPFNYYGYNQSEADIETIKKMWLNNNAYELILTNASMIKLQLNDQKICTFDLNPMIHILNKKYGEGYFNHILPNELEITSTDFKNNTYKISINSLRIEIIDNKKMIQSIEGNLLIKLSE